MQHHQLQRQNSMDTSKRDENITDEGAVEKKVETVNYRHGPGSEKEPAEEKVEVTHLPHTDEEKPGVLKEAAEKVAEKIESAKAAAKPSGQN
uniref:Early dehydration inducible protein n=1 Tax=Craterostigma plantagineum TaxID=4153 RepID=Q5QJC1_CRAPL|nr:early dehydration inducible protein [Craterostigma plantagineum]